MDEQIENLKLKLVETITSAGFDTGESIIFILSSTIADLVRPDYTPVTEVQDSSYSVTEITPEQQKIINEFSDKINTDKPSPSPEIIDVPFEVPIIVKKEPKNKIPNFMLQTDGEDIF